MLTYEQLVAKEKEETRLKIESLMANDSSQFIIIKRYDDKGGAWALQVTTWPNTEDESFWSTTKNIGFLDNPGKMRRDLVAKDFFCNKFTDMEAEFQHYIIHNILPIEWHRWTPEQINTRVAIYMKAS